MDARTVFLHAVKYHQAGNVAQAIPLYQDALTADPTLGDAALYLGMALQMINDYPAAEKAYTQAIALLPGDPDPLNNLGAVQLELGKIQEAKTSHLTALKLSPTSAEALSGLGNVFLTQGHFNHAIDLFQQTLSIAPDSPDVLNNLGIAYKSIGRPQEAVETLEKALALNPAAPDTLYNLGNAWQMRGDMKEARQCFQTALKTDPNYVGARWGACFAHLETLYDTETEVKAARSRYADALHQLDNDLRLDTPEQIRDAAEAVGGNQPFYLTYQGKNDRDLQKLYGALVHRIMTTAYPQFAAPSFLPRTRAIIRVGIATGFMHEHSVWKIPTRGWVHHLDRSKFEVFGYYTGVKEDHCTNEARDHFDKLTHEPHNFEQLCSAIITDDLDVLIYPDIGMDPICAKLAGLRLAPVQCVSLGHPMTTGLPSMDYFLSSDLMEPENGTESYTEELVRLPNLSMHYSPLRQGDAQFDRAHFGLPEGKLLYFCPQSLYKYLPMYDQLYPLIATEVADAHFVFLESGSADRLNEHFRTRLSRCFAANGMDFKKYVTILPYQAQDEYHTLNCLCDVFLDSIEWSGFNTTMEAANTGLPAITCPKGHMRGHHSYAVITMLECHEAVATSFQNYVALAIRMGNDADFRHSLCDKTKENRPRLFNDLEAVRGLESFIERVAR